MTGHDGIGLYALRCEQMSDVLAACRDAHGLVRSIIQALDAAGLSEHVTESAGVVDGAGQPVAALTITFEGVRQLARLLATTPGLLPAEAMNPPPDESGPDKSTEAA